MAPYDIVNDSVGETEDGQPTEVFVVKVMRLMLQKFHEMPYLTLPMLADEIRDVVEGFLHLHADGFDVMASVTEPEFAVATHRAIQLHDMQEEKNEEIARQVHETEHALRENGFELTESLWEAMQNNGLCECSFQLARGVHYCPYRGRVYDGRNG